MKLGIIGCGFRVSHVVALILKYDMGVELAAVADVNEEGAKKWLADRGVKPDGVTFYKDADEMLQKERLDGVLIGTRCYLHAAMAIKVLQKNIALFLEKPVAIHHEELLQLKKAYEQSSSKVVVSFPLKVSAHVQLAKEIIGSGKLGAIEHVEAVNNLPAINFYKNWYRDEKLTNGLFLQMASHDLDYITHLVGLKPVEVFAMKSKQVYKGQKKAGLFCKDCAENRTCPESPYVVKFFNNDNTTGEQCCFATDTGNEDSGSALIRYESGMHVSYSQNFYSKKGAFSRGARFIGYNGTLEISWATDDVKVMMHHTDRDETYKLHSDRMPHGTGDDKLALNFIGVMNKTAESVSPLEEGLMNALLCICATDSANTHALKKIQW